MHHINPAKPRLQAWAPALTIALVASMVCVLVVLGGVARAETTTTGVTAGATGSTVVTTAGTVTTGTPATQDPAGSASGLTPAPAGFEPPNPGLVAAQMGVQFWPEYDTKDVLVLLDVTLPATTVFPFKFTFYIPNGARLAGLAEIDENGAFDYTLGTPTLVPGEVMTAVTVTVPKRPVLRLEYYYDPGMGAPGAKSFPVQFQAPADAGTLYVEVQEPLKASGFSAGAVLNQTTTDGQGFTFHYGSVPGVKAGDMFQTQVEYTKTDPEPSVSSAAPGGDPATQQSSSYLLWLLIVLVVAVGGIVVYRLFIRKPSASTQRSRSASGPGSRPVRGGGGPIPKGGTAGSRPAKKSGRTDTADSGSGPTRFCTQCGGRLSKKDRFCPQCGAGRDS
ncbi:MAG: zinc ribbon domain-containing protein [Thermoleophilia bacterium]